ncbi:PIN domain-like protein [Crassisporium funariophilum]|nr:PIN domain-like protein [Crassisporium funariophilum]
MGVQGLTPFLQKTCPSVFKQLPNRLQDLRGKRVVIDGTLITQRLHYAPSPHQYRHVLGWYRIATELNESGVTAICVFDGQERNLAKAREAERRREVRRLTFSRSTIELDRFKRLQDLQGVLQLFRKLDVEERQNVVKSLLDTDFVSQDGPAGLLRTSLRPLSLNDTPSSLSITKPFSPRVPQEQQDPVSEEITQLASSDTVASLFKSMYLNYKASVAKVVSLTSQSPDRTSATLPSTDDEEDRVEQSATKAQHQLTLEEGDVWKGIAAPLLTDTLDTVEMSASLVDDLDSLVYKSQMMSTSFQRRINAPTAQTYKESQEILLAMGFPCIKATGAVEAEALASSLVLSGVADYVATEDTDVLVYEAPMVKNITNRDGPVVLVSGADIRAALDLDRNSFVDFAVLLGTDFSDRIKNVGPSRALKFIKDHGSIERILELEPKYPPRLPIPAYLAQVDIARTVFKTLPPVPPLETMQQTEKNDTEVAEVLRMYGLGRFLAEHDLENWDHDAALTGNYFEDNPSAL